MIPNAYRTFHCNAVRSEHIGQTVTLCGWVNSARDHGGVIFIDLRDREGLTQVVFRPEENAELAAQSHHLRDEDVLQITGKVAARLVGTENAKLGTGAVEIVATECTVLNKADVLPFQLDRELSNEDMRMKYRYLDLRRERMNKNIRTRHKITNTARNYRDAAGFIEVETPILSNPTPEGDLHEPFTSLWRIAGRMMSSVVLRASSLFDGPPIRSNRRSETLHGHPRTPGADNGSLEEMALGWAFGRDGTWVDGRPRTSGLS